MPLRISHHRRAIAIVATILIAAGVVFSLVRNFQQTRVRRIQSGNAIEVRAGDDFQAALNAARCGETIVLQAGATFQGNGDKGFVFPEKGCNDYITVTTSNPGGLPGGRVDMNHAAAMPKIVPPSFGGTTYPAMTFPKNSKFWKFVGIEVTTLPNQAYENVLIDVGPYTAWDEAPSDLTFDRVYVHSLEDGTNNPEGTARIGFNVFARRLELKNSRVAFPAGYVKGTKTVDNQYAFLSIAGPGPITIDNCFLSAWYNIIFTGGGSLPTPNEATVSPGATLSQATLSNVNNLHVGDLIALKQSDSYYGAAKVIAINGSRVTYTPYSTSIGPAGGGSPLNAPPLSPGKAQWNGYNPQDFTIKHNTFYINPVIARTILDQTGNSPKGFFEIKSMDGMLMEGNDFQGFPSVWAFTARNQGSPRGAPSVWSTIRNVTLRSNRYIPNFPSSSRQIVFQLEDNYATCTPGGNILLENNLVVNIGNVADLAGGSGITFRHNTFITNFGSQMLNNIGTVVQNLVFKDNIVANNEYGVHCVSQGYSCFPDLFNGNMLGNLIVGRAMPYRPTCGNPYPAGNNCTDTFANVGFVDAPTGVYKLAPASRFKGRASDGKDPGVDMDQLMSAIGSGNARQ